MRYAHTQRRKSQENEIEVKIGKIESLADAKYRLLWSLTIGIPLQEIQTSMVDPLNSMLTSSKESRVKLYFEVFDAEKGTAVKLYSRSRSVLLNKELINFLQEKDHL